MSINPDEKKKLTHIVERYAQLNSDIKAMRFEQKELADAAFEKTGVPASVVKQLAKESAWDDIKRERQKQHEEKVDECRVALGMLLDTPLGQAAEAATENGHDADETQHHVTDPKYKAPRRRGRPKAEKEAASVN